MDEDTNTGADFTEIRGDRLLTEYEASEFLSLSVRTLQHRRLRNLDPAWVKLGTAVRYRLPDLIDWVQKNTKTPHRAA